MIHSQLASLGAGLHPAPPSDNPFSNKAFYVNPAYVAELDSSIATAEWSTSLASRAEMDER